MAAVAMLAVLVAACSQPRADATLRITPDGIKVRPVVSGTVGGVGVAVSP